MFTPISEELGAIRDFLERMVERPSMYGSPEEIEETAKHLAHTGLTIIDPHWRFSDTQAWWTQVALDVVGASKLADDDDYYKIMRHWRWGPHEAKSREQVVRGFTSIARNPSPGWLPYPTVSQWLSTLL